MPNQRSKDRLHNYFEYWFVPMALGVTAVAVAVQLIGMVPSVRQAMDRVEGRFQQTSAVNAEPPGLSGTTAVLTLRVKGKGSDVQVMKNHVSLGDFTTSEMRVIVREGDVIQFTDMGNTDVVITIDSNNVHLLRPAPGQVIALTSTNRSAQLTPVEFL